MPTAAEITRRDAGEGDVAVTASDIVEDAASTTAPRARAHRTWMIMSMVLRYG